ncbi:hypothetical protein CH369_10675 [Leptospira levettii]|nr:hypothetical protein CH368_12755 [Leptospira levettii]PKA00014.1 hypothetical protein CH369_10675 [Leptospira levettii]
MEWNLWKVLVFSHFVKILQVYFGGLGVCYVGIGGFGNIRVFEDRERLVRRYRSPPVSNWVG